MSDADHTREAVSGLDKIVVERDAGGRRKPIEVYVKEFGDTVEARPMNEDAQDKYLQPLGEAATMSKALADGDIDRDELSEEEREEIEQIKQGGKDALSDAKLAEMFEEHIAEPDLVAAYQENHPEEEIDGLDADFVRHELVAGAKDGLMFAVLLASGKDEFVAALRGEYEEDEDEDESGN